MSLVGKLLGKVLTRGRLHLISADGSRESFGPGGAEEVTVRLHDKRVAFDIARDPKLAFGEAYMDGRLTIEQGDILQLLELALGNNRRCYRRCAAWFCVRRERRGWWYAPSSHEQYRGRLSTQS